MSFLFDVSPTETSDKKSPRKQRPALAEKQSPPAPSFVHTPRSYADVVSRELKTIDHTYDCADGACGAQCHDILKQEKGDWYIACAFCGTGQWVPALVDEEEEKPQDQVFRLRGGRFPGMTLDEVSLLDDGMGCITWWATGKHDDDAVRDAAKKWLAVNEEKHLDTIARPR